SALLIPLFFFIMLLRPPISQLFPYTTLFRSDHIPGARARAKAGELAFGTIDTWLLWQLTKGAVHATDATNASRTLLFNIHTQERSEEHTSELQSRFDLVCRLLLEKKNNNPLQ